MARHILAQLNAAQSQITKARAELLALTKEQLADLCINLAGGSAPVAPPAPEQAPEQAPLAAQPNGAAATWTVADAAAYVLLTHPGLTTRQICEQLQTLGRTVKHAVMHQALTGKKHMFAGENHGPGNPMTWSLKPKKRGK